MKFYGSLESLRGIAALMVALSHSLGAFKITHVDSALYKSVLKVLGNGGVGVTIFFVLSGFVLASSIDAARRSDLKAWLAFWMRRFLRIFPAMLAVLLGCALILATFSFTRVFDAASTEYYHYWQEGVSLKRLIDNALLAGNYLNPVTWTLQVEAWGALFFPVLYHVAKTSRIAALALLAGLTAYFVAAPLYSYARTGFVFMFMLGLLAHDLRVWLAQLPAASLKGLSGAAFILCCLSHLVFPETEASGWVVEAVFAMVLIASLTATAESERVGILATGGARFLGRISYSFYLWHFPVAYLVATALLHSLPGSVLLAYPNAWQIALFLATTALTIPVAHASYLWIERPCMAAGKRWTSSIGALSRPV